MPLKDAQFIEGMKFDKGEIANIFNIPLHMINELDVLLSPILSNRHWISFKIH